MLRAIFIYLSKAVWARKMVTGWGLAWRAASRFVAGEKLEDAIRTIQLLNAKGINATLDHLGENTTNIGEASRAVDDILKAIDAIQDSGVRANISIKLTQIGLTLGEDVCAENLRRVLNAARDCGNFIRIDMEDATCTEATIGLLNKMHSEGFSNTGVVIQSYLYRSAEDVQQIAGEGVRIRLCKGAYKESPQWHFLRRKM